MNHPTSGDAFALEWTRISNGEATPHMAMTKSRARTPTDLTIDYQGWSKEDSNSFAGTIRLRLNTVEQEVSGIGSLGRDPAPFRLVGVFKNEQCTLFEGTWYEDPD